MVLEAVLYFILGFLCAGLLALMVSPAIWNRAVVLTRRKIESSVPLTLNEVQADKDQLRAEFAMSTRRLEMSIQELKDRASNQIIEINRRRDEVSKLNDESKERLQTINEMEERSLELRRMLREREDQYKSLSKQVAELTKVREKNQLELEDIRVRLADKEEEVSGQRLEIATKDTRIEALSQAAESTGLADDQKLQKITSLEEEVAELKAKLKSIEDENVEFAQALEKRDLDLNKTRIQREDSQDELTEMSSKLVDQQALNVELEAKLASQTLQMEVLLNDASDENVQKAMKVFKDKFDKQAVRLKELKAERDSLEAEVRTMATSTADEWSVERQENAILRERINDMATSIAVMADKFEGDSSQLSKIIADAKAPKKAASKEDKSDSEKAASLASRIRALQQVASNS